MPDLPSPSERSYRDALPQGVPNKPGADPGADGSKLSGSGVHRRGAGLNPGNRFEDHRLHVLGDAIDYEHQLRQWEGEDGKPVTVPLRVYADKTQRLINKVAPTSDVPFNWTVNPYRGCEHGCVYCFARPYHEYLGFSMGLDFETKLVAKHRTPQLLARELANPRWKAEPIVMSAITDIYQPIEKQLKIARACLEVMADCNQPTTTMTKNTLVLRDTDLWSAMSAKNCGRVTVTLVTLDEDLASRLEPRASPPSGRLRVIRELTKAGVQVSVNIAPVIPGLTDKEVPAILDAVAEAGAKRVAWVMLRLPYQLKDLFIDWLDRHVPQRSAHIESLIRQTQGGKLYDAKKHVRRRGQGVIAEQVAMMFDVFTRRHGLNRNLQPLTARHFRRPNNRGQMQLFGG